MISESFRRKVPLLVSQKLLFNFLLTFTFRYIEIQIWRRGRAQRKNGKTDARARETKMAVTGVLVEHVLVVVCEFVKYRSAFDERKRMGHVSM